MTLKELAKKLDVSVSTVSCALRGMPNISDDTRKRVVEAAKQYGYMPSFAARQLRQNAKSRKSANETLEIAFLLRGRQQYDPVYGRMVLGASRQLGEVGHHMQLLAQSEQDLRELPDAVTANRFDGIIVSGHIDLDFIDLVAANGHPLVVLGNYDNIEDQYFNVRLDIRGMIEKLLNRCYENGHHRIAFMTKNRKIAFERHCEEVYEAWMKATDIWDPQLAQTMNDTYGVPDKQTDQLLGLSQPPTAIVTLDVDLARMIEDQVNIHHKEFINKIQFACPAMNNEPFNPKYDVAVVDYSAMGAAAARLLPDIIKDPEMPVQQQVISAKLIKS